MATDLKDDLPCSDVHSGVSIVLLFCKILQDAEDFPFEFSKIVNRFLEFREDFQIRKTIFGTFHNIYNYLSQKQALYGKANGKFLFVEGRGPALDELVKSLSQLGQAEESRTSAAASAEETTILLENQSLGHLLSNPRANSMTRPGERAELCVENLIHYPCSSLRCKRLHVHPNQIRGPSQLFCRQFVDSGWCRLGRQCSLLHPRFGSSEDASSATRRKKEYLKSSYHPTRNIDLLAEKLGIEDRQPPRPGPSHARVPSSHGDGGKTSGGTVTVPVVSEAAERILLDKIDKIEEVHMSNPDQLLSHLIDLRNLVVMMSEQSKGDRRRGPANSSVAFKSRPSGHSGGRPPFKRQALEKALDREKERGTASFVGRSLPAATTLQEPDRHAAMRDPRYM